MAMNFSLAEAEQLSPKRIQSRIVRELEQMEQGDTYVASNYFPMYQMGSAKEIYHRQSGKVSPMSGTSLVSESKVAGLEDLDEDSMSITTLKRKISPEKAVDTALNSEQQILNIAEYVANNLLESLMMSRSMMSWRSWNNVDGMIGEDGTSPHPKIPNTHVESPATQFSDTANSSPHDFFMRAAEDIDTDGSGFNNLGPITAVMSPSVMWDLMANDNLESRFSGVATQVIDDLSKLSQVIPVQIEIVRTEVPRTNDNGEPLDSDGNVVPLPDATFDNILEPWDGSNRVRNIVVGTYGQDAALMPWFTDRLEDHLDDVPPGGNFSVDVSNGYIVQSWTTHDPIISWRKIAQEIGFEMIRGDNFAIIQDV